MRSMISEICQCVVLQGIFFANHCYQQSFRGMARENLFAPIVASVTLSSLHVASHAQEINSKDKEESYKRYTNAVRNTSIGVAIATVAGSFFYGKRCGYDTGFWKDIGSFILLTLAYTSTLPQTKSEETKTSNQQRLRLILTWTCSDIAMSCISSKLEASRNPTFSLRSHVCFNVVFFTARGLQQYHQLGQTLIHRIFRLTRSNEGSRQLVRLVHEAVSLFAAAWFAKVATGQSIRMDWHWTIVAYVAAAAAARVCFAPHRWKGN